MKKMALIAVAVFSLVIYSSCEENMCISEGTAIATPYGPKFVEQLQVGDIVLSPDPVTAQMYTGRVVSIQTAIRKCLAMTFENGAVLRVTPEHPVWDALESEFKPAAEFSASDFVSVSIPESPARSRARIVHIDKQVERCRVFNLSIASLPHTFVANGVVVHNKPPLPNPPPPPVTDLRVEPVDDTSALAIWTEPGPTFTRLSTAQFFLDTVEVTDSTLDMAREITVDLMSASGGSVDSTVLTGLKPSTTYHTRMRVFGGGFSALSNSAIFTTGP